MEKERVQEILQSVHEIECKEGRIIGRKELHKHLPDGLSYEEKHTLIKAWKAAYWVRLNATIEHRRFNHFVEESKRQGQWVDPTA